MFYHHKGLCCILIVTTTIDGILFKKHLKEFFAHIFHVYCSLHQHYLAELASQATPMPAGAALLS